MSDADRTFTQSMSENYENLLGPVLFVPMAPFTVDVVAAIEPSDVLETAAGTGIVTRLLAERLPDSQIVATDLSQPMLDYGASVAPRPNVRWQQADAQDLPFDDDLFDVAVCQFGAMFFPDRGRAYRESRRVLRSGGSYVVGIWGDLDHNPITGVATRASEPFLGGPPTFAERVPHGYADVDRIRADLTEAGFQSVDVAIAAAVAQTSAASFARGFASGTPQLADYDGDKDAVVAAMAERLVAELGVGDGDIIEGPTQALIVTAT
jgi:SAM-dependent methyltransferase